MRTVTTLVAVAGALGVAFAAATDALMRPGMASAATAFDRGSAPAPDPAVAARIQSLQGELTRAIRSPRWRGDEWGVLVVSLDRGDTLFALNPDRPLAPASNMKLYTTAAALRYLGPDFRFATYLVTTGTVRDGILDGDLVVYGTGDPTLSDRLLEDASLPWRRFADALRAHGIREVRGDLVGDASYFASPSVGSGWQDAYMNASYAAPSSALSYNENIVSLHVRPAAEEGWRPEVVAMPGGRGLSLVNLATTTSGGGTSVRVQRSAYDGPILVEGRIARGAAGVWRSVPVGDPARYSVAAFREVLEEAGIVVRGALHAVNHPSGSVLGERRVFAPAFEERPVPRVLAVHASPPLLDILKVINQRSQNLYAEQVLRALGRVVHGEGTAEAGARAILAFMREDVGIDPAGLEIHDGSGLSVLNRTTAREIVLLLDHMARSEHAAFYWETLPVSGGERGDLRRMRRTAAEGNLRAKTGTIRNVSALSGYVRAGNGERLAFSILSNRVPSTWAAKRVEDAIGSTLAGFDRPPVRPPVAAPDRIASDASVADTVRGVDPSAAREATSDEQRTHVVGSGETLDGIARRYDVSLEELQRANPGIQPRRLLPGRMLSIP